MWRKESMLQMLGGEKNVNPSRKQSEPTIVTLVGSNHFITIKVLTSSHTASNVVRPTESPKIAISSNV